MKIKCICILIISFLLFPNLTNEKESLVEKGNFIHLQGTMNERNAFNHFHNNILSFIFSILFSNFKEKWRNSSPSSLNDQIDQSQEKSDSYYEIYGDNWFAQSFKNTKGKLTKIEILINKHTKTLSISDKLSSGSFRSNLRMSLFGGRKKTLEAKPSPTNNNIGNLTVAVRHELDGEDIVNKTLSPDQIPKNRKGNWITFDFTDVDIWVDTTYYIVVYSDGGDGDNYYRWYYGDNNPYSNGYAQYSINAGISWNSLDDIDFCFKTYSSISGEEPDGVVERWALLVGVAEYTNPEKKAKYADYDAIDFKNVLVHHGWQEDHIVVLTNEQATTATVLSYLDWLDRREDQDDIVIYSHTSHGGLIPGYSYLLSTYDGGIWDYELDAKFDNLGSKNVLVVLDCCESGGFIPTLRRTGRVILTSCKSHEYTGVTDELRNSVFLYFLVSEEDIIKELPGIDGAFAREDCDTNHDGWVSAEEAYEFAAPWTAWYATWGMHPQKYDGCTGHLKITKV